MNKQLIIKHRAEFNHWLYGGSLLFSRRFKDGSGFHKWQPLDNFNFNEQDNLVIIINDEYVEFRKALVEGETIERYYGQSRGDVTWVDSNATDMLNYTPKLLRIKPGEPRFNVGDTVILECIDNSKGLYKIK